LQNDSEISSDACGTVTAKTRCCQAGVVLLFLPSLADARRERQMPMMAGKIESTATTTIT
jgi:hypothetical protein